MGDAGLFADERVELLDGTIVTMSAQHSPHAGTVWRLHRLLVRTVEDNVPVRAQLPIILDDWSEPEPDVAVCMPDPYDYTRSHPKPHQIMLVCEVASSSLSYDRSAKAAAYAASGIPEYWIVDVASRSIQVLTEPDPENRRYRAERRLTDDDTVPAPSGTILAVRDILPPV